MKYDVIVLGGGPGGYVAAIKAAQLGGRVALIEKERLGGVCLNWGCIPTKALLKNARVYNDILESSTFGIEGIEMDRIIINWKKMLERKNQVVDRLVKGVESLMQKNKIDIYNGFGSFKDEKSVEVNGQLLEAERFIIATGARPAMPDLPGLAESIKAGYALTSKEILDMEELPKSLLILGGGVIAVEFATLFNTLGVEVTMLQRSDRILNTVEKEMAQSLGRHLKKKGVKIITNVAIKAFNGNEVVTEKAGVDTIYSADRILVSLGNKPNLAGLERLSLEVDSKGINTNEDMSTNIKNIYAIGDVNGKYTLAHVASAEGIVAATNCMGGEERLNYQIVPSCIYSFPEIASVGLTEEEARAEGYSVIISKFPLSANGKALAEGESVGFIKIIADEKYGEILGTHIMAAHATDMISEAIISMQLEGTAHDVAKAIHPHPTLSEIVMEAAHGLVGLPIHF